MNRPVDIAPYSSLVADAPADRLDEAARAAWLHFVAGHTQNKVAEILNISRQSTQRLISLAVEAKLVRIEVIHPITRCMALADALCATFGLRKCTIVPTDPTSAIGTLGVSMQAAAQMERYLRAEAPLILGVGTGHTLSAAAANVSPMNCSQHRIVACVGSTSIEGWATFNDVAMRLARAVRARYYPMPAPIMANSPEERQVLLDQKPVRKVIEIARNANVVFLGIGHLQEDATLLDDGFVTAIELAALQAAGAVGEVVGCSFDAKGRFIDGLTNERVVSIPPGHYEAADIIGAAAGQKKVAPILGALRGGLINGLITDERTAQAVIKLGQNG